MSSEPTPPGTPSFSQTMRLLRETQDNLVAERSARIRAEKNDAESWSVRVKYAAAARVIALHLKEFCNDALPYDEMIADASRIAKAELDAERSARQKAEGERDALQAKLAEVEESAKRSITAIANEFERQMNAIVGDRDQLAATFAELRKERERLIAQLWWNPPSVPA